MRRWMSLVAALLLCLTMVHPVSADTFVPSISYKDGPGVKEAEMDGKKVTGCVVVTSLRQADEKATDITQTDRDLLLQVYEKLSENSMKLPLENTDFVVRELVDVSFMQKDCVEVPHGHKEWLAKENTTISVTFDLGVWKGQEVEVFVYLDGQWTAVEEVVNNGDGTVTCVLEDFCPVAFCTNPKDDEKPPQTGDANGEDLLLWTVLLVGSLGAVVILLANRRRLIR